jgi:bile acid:Na+ symporter, BASS family
MTELFTILLKISLVIFMAGNLLDMGLRLNPQDALRGLRNVRFVVHTLLWGFVVGPALAYGITLVIPLADPYAMGLILLGMTPCAPFLPMIVDKAKGDLGYTAAFMLLASAGTVLFMPFGVPLLVKGLTVSAWAIAKPLIIVVLLPLAVGMLILRASAALAAKIQPVVKKITGISTLAVAVLCVVVYGKGLLGVPGSLAVAAQLVFFAVVTAFPYWFGFGLQPGQKIVVSAGMATRNLGAALAPLFSVAAIDQRAIVMVVLGLPIMVIFAFLAAKLFGLSASPAVAGSASSVRGRGVAR